MAKKFLDNTEKKYTEANMWEFALDYMERFQFDLIADGRVKQKKADEFLTENIKKFNTDQMARLDIEKQKELEPIRIQYAKDKLKELGIEVEEEATVLVFKYKGSTVRLYPYSGWHTGKTIKDGRGIDKLLKQLK